MQKSFYFVSKTGAFLENSLSKWISQQSKIRWAAESLKIKNQIDAFEKGLSKQSKFRWAAESIKRKEKENEVLENGLSEWVS